MVVKASLQTRKKTVISTDSRVEKSQVELKLKIIQLLFLITL